jgi:hypothetical protein
MGTVGVGGGWMDGWDTPPGNFRLSAFGFRLVAFKIFEDFEDRRGLGEPLKTNPKVVGDSLSFTPKEDVCVCVCVCALGGWSSRACVVCFERFENERIGMGVDLIRGDGEEVGERIGR